MSLSTFFHDFFERFTAVVKSIVAFILPIAESDAGSLISAALPLALTIIQTVGQSGATGVAARDQAVADLRAELIKQGVADAQSIGASTLNFIVETALQNLKATTPAPATS